MFFLILLFFQYLALVQLDGRRISWKTCYVKRNGRRSMRTSWSNIPIRCCRYSIRTKMESCNWARWQSKWWMIKHDSIDFFLPLTETHTQKKDLWFSRFYLSLFGCKCQVLVVVSAIRINSCLLLRPNIIATIDNLTIIGSSTHFLFCLFVFVSVLGLNDLAKNIID